MFSTKLLLTAFAVIILYCHSSGQNPKTAKPNVELLFNQFFALSDQDSAERIKKINLASQIRKADTTSKFYYYTVAWAAIKKGDKKVDYYIDKLIDSHPNWAEIYLLKAQDLFNREKPDHVEWAQKAIELNPKLAAPYYLLGVSYFQSGNYKLSLLYYNKLELYAPDHKSLYYNRANLKDALEDYQGAIADFTTAIKKAPGHSRAIFNRGVIYLRVEEYPAAEADFTRFLSFFPSDPDAYYYRAAARHYQEKYDLACGDFKKAAALGNEPSKEHLLTACK